MIEPYPYGGWGPKCYRAMHHDDLITVELWLRENHVDYWLVSTGSGGYIIQIKGNDALFKLRWL
jgi:hypothetical protein